MFRAPGESGSGFVFLGMFSVPGAGLRDSCALHAIPTKPEFLPEKGVK